MGMKGMTATEVAAKHKKNAGAAVKDYKDGIMRVKVAPGEKAAASKDKMRANLLKKIDDGTWEKRVAGVTLPQWQAATAGKGAERYTGGINAGEKKMRDFMEEFLPHLERGVTAVEQMDNLTLEDSINRVAAMIRHNASFKRS